MAAHSSVLAWRIPGMAEPGGLLSMGLHRVRHDWSDLAAAAAAELKLAIQIIESGLLPPVSYAADEETGSVRTTWLKLWN